ncbi:MAG: radical SAM protein [Candidatus Cloacimonetes bacterium]|nr:radical SAM protein [Candidatus Cloacimonadota bacterium]
MQKIKTKLVYPIFISHIGCPNQCIFCNQYSITKVISIDWEKTKEDIKRFVNKHNGKYKEIAFFGGSFTSLSEEYMQELFDKISPCLDETTFFRVSCRPDAINQEILNFLRKNKVKTIELGIQSFSDIELLKSKRGYTKEIALKSCMLIKQNDFMLGLQFLIGLPNFSSHTFEETLQTTLSINPEYIRLYPLLVLKNTELETLYKSNLYSPLTLEEAVEKCVYFAKKISQTDIVIIKIGLHSDININKQEVVAGPYHPNFGESIKGRLLAEKIITYLKHKDLMELHISDSTASQLFTMNSYSLNYIEKTLKKKIKIYIDKYAKKQYR